jgi:DNA-binding SARP family transcriptional activator
MRKASATALTSIIGLKLLGSPQAFKSGWHGLSAEQPCLLGIYLAYHHTWVNREDILKLFWQQESDRTKANLRQLIYRTHKLFWAEHLETSPTHLRLIIKTDIYLFKEALQQGDWPRAIRLYEDAFLLGLHSKLAGFNNWLEQEREQLADAWHKAVLNYSWQLDSPAEHIEATVLLSQLLQRDSLNEDAMQHYLYHLYLAGERTQALRKYLEFKDELNKELGASPLAATEQLIDAIRQHKPLNRSILETLLGRPSPRGSILASLKPEAASNVPRPNSLFVGRKKELANLSRALQKHRLLTLMGIGGSGKTRLALELAQQVQALFADGISFVDLVGVSDPEKIAAKIVEILRLDLRGNVSAQEKLLNYLADKKMLLILDNFEHLLEGASICERLLEASPNLQLLITSREVLGLSYEARYALAGLQLPQNATEPLENVDAIRLFLDRAQHIRLDFALDPVQREATIRICRLLAGIPLAIELAVTWLSLLNPEAIANDLAHSLHLLETNEQQVPERHRSMRIVMEKSWQLLSPEEQRVLKTLTIFSGSFSKNHSWRFSQLSSLCQSSC